MLEAIALSWPQVPAPYHGELHAKFAAGAFVPILDGTGHVTVRQMARLA